VSLEYLAFTSRFPDILSRLVGRVDGALMFWLVQILYSELGSGDETRSHDRLFRQLCFDIGLREEDIIDHVVLESTAQLNRELLKLYDSGALWAAIGAQFALEIQADNMLRELRTAFEVVDYPGHSIRGGIPFFEVHECEEPEHIVAMKCLVAKGLQNGMQRKCMEEGVMRCTQLFGAFWNGVGRKLEQ